jgi:ubiquinone/menaquinone biosynthesis C-methylase UbiE
MQADLIALNKETQKVWDENADGWDAKMAEGNRFFRELIWPATHELLHLDPGDCVLDVACGNGTAARRMAEGGAEVHAFDFSPRLVELARTRGESGITYSVGDATDPGAYSVFSDGQFDAVHCGMAIFDIADVSALFTSIRRLIKPEGRFVFL